MFKVTLNAHAHRRPHERALPPRRSLEDPEFYQFHPTGLYKLGVLLTGGARGEGGILRNSEVSAMELRPDDQGPGPQGYGPRAMYMEIREGRGRPTTTTSTST
ncbi:MAG: FAD-binding protein [Chloroflexia bacterium]